MRYNTVMRRFVSKLRSWWRSRSLVHERLVDVRIRRQALLHNLDRFAEGGLSLAPVLKANAYGHGLVEVANVVKDHPAVSFLVVESYYEALLLRKNGITKDVLVVGYTPAATIKQSNLSNVTFTVTSLEQLKQLAGSFQALHLKIDTGMSRYGLSPHELPQALEVIAGGNVKLTGVLSHLADAYEPGSEFTHQQIKEFNAALEKVREQADVQYAHLSATSGFFYKDTINASVMRVGVGMYGITSYGANLDLKPALSMHTKVAQVKHVSAGTTVGYNRAFKASEDMTIAILPIGYYEGVDRRLSNQGVVEIKDKLCPIIGKVSMNATMVDVSELSKISEEEAVTVISADPDSKLSALQQAQMAGTIPHEILCGIPERLHRTIVK